MEFITKHIKTTFSGIKQILNYNNATTEEEVYYMNMTPNECGDCKWIYKLSSNYYKCYYYPPTAVAREDLMNSRIASVRPTVLRSDKACSMFERRSRWDKDYDVEDSEAGC